MIIYKTTNLINGKIYIGQDKHNDPKYLGSGIILNKSIKKNGKENFKKEILEICDSVEMMNEREIYWIEFYDARNNKIGYNITKGGEGRLGLQCSEKNKEKLKILFGHKVYQHDLKGNFIQKFESIHDAGNITNTDCKSITLCCKKEVRVCGGFVWRYYQIDELEKEEIKQEFINKPYIDNTEKEIYQYDSNGVFIKKYKTLTLASKETNTNINSIVLTCKQKRLTGNEFIWSYYSLNDEEIEVKKKCIDNKRSGIKKVSQYNLNGNFIKLYESVTIAANLTCSDRTSIANCCRGLNKTANGFIWKYA